MNPTLREIGNLARQARCEVDLRKGGKIILRRGKKKLTGTLHPLAAIAWLHREGQLWAEGAARAKIEKQRQQAEKR